MFWVNLIEKEIKFPNSHSYRIKLISLLTASLLSSSISFSTSLEDQKVIVFGNFFTILKINDFIKCNFKIYKNSEDVSLVDIHAPNNPNSRANLWAESCPYQQLLLVDVIIYISRRNVLMNPEKWNCPFTW